MTWCGHLRLRSERVISPLRLVIAEVSTFDLGGSLPILRHRRITLTAADESYSNSEPRPPPVALRVKQNGRSDETSGHSPRAQGVVGRKNPDALCRSATGPSERKRRAQESPPQIVA
jgi:hypothetical protein